MPYGNFSYTIDSSFHPFSFQEMLQPLAIYKDAYEKAEDDYLNLANQSDKFKYLSETLPEGSKARKLYEGYAEELNKQATDLAKHGLNMNNRRALTNLKRRYQGEIGRLVTADAAMQEEKKLRRTMNAKDTSMLYAQDNLSIDDFMDGSTPNLYNISGNELYAKGAAIGKGFSSRVYGTQDGGRTLGGYYRDYIQRMGYTPEQLSRFSNEIMNNFASQVSTLPELQQAANSILDANGVTVNLKGNSLKQAQQQVIRGIVDNAIYNEEHRPVRDEGVMSASAREQYALQREQMTKSAAQNGLTWDANSRSWKYDMEKDPAYQRQKAIAEKKAELGIGSGSTKGRSGTAYDVRNKTMTMVGANSGSVYKQDGADGNGTRLDEAPMRALTEQEYSQLVDAHGNITNQYLRNAIGNGQLSDYEIYVIPKGSTELTGTGWFDNDDLDEDIYVAIPRESKRAATEFTGNAATSGYGDNNDIPE